MTITLEIDNKNEFSIISCDFHFMVSFANSSRIKKQKWNGNVASEHFLHILRNSHENIESTKRAGQSVPWGALQELSIMHSNNSHHSLHLIFYLELAAFRYVHTGDHTNFTRKPFDQAAKTILWRSIVIHMANVPGNEMKWKWQMFRTTDTDGHQYTAIGQRQILFANEQEITVWNEIGIGMCEMC